jgi:pseudolysin
MHPNYYCLPLAIAAAILLSSPVKAAEAVFLQQASFSKIKNTYQLLLPGKATQVAANHAPDSLNFISQHTDKKQITHIRMQQYYAGFPVFGGYAIMHSANKAEGLGIAHSGVQMNGTLYEGLSAELGKAPPTFMKRATDALNQLKSQYVQYQISEEQVKPIVYIDEQHHAHWAYKVSVFVNYPNSIPKRPTAILDADTLKPFHTWNDVKTVKSPAFGRGSGGNEKVGEYQFGKDFRLLDITRDASLSLCFMENTEVKVVDMEHDYYSANNPMQFLCDNDPNNPPNTYMTGLLADGYDRENGAYSPLNDALYAGYVIKHMYHDWYGVEVLTKPNGRPMQLVMRVHYGLGYENAYWDGRNMTFGDGEHMLYPLVSLGVGGHEVSHGFTEQHADLEYFGQSGGMNESFSDMGAQAAEFYAFGKNNWKIGSEIMKPDSGYDALRYMDRPSRDGWSIDTQAQYVEGMDVHHSSGVFNRLFYLLATKPNWGVQKAFDVMVKANMDYWTPLSTFDEGGCGVVRATEDLGYPLDDVKAALDEVLVHHEVCVVQE